MRFENGTAAIYVYCGMKLGDAAYLGALSPGQVTPYFETSQGSYTVELMGNDGVWHADTASPFNISVNQRYTLALMGTLPSSYHSLSQDD